MPSAYRRILSPQYIFPLVTASWQNKRILFYSLLCFFRDRDLKNLGIKMDASPSIGNVIPCSSLLIPTSFRRTSPNKYHNRLKAYAPAPASPTWPELFCPGWATLFVWRKVMVPFPSLLHLPPSPPLRTFVTRETDGSCIDCYPKKESKDMESKKGRGANSEIER